jgi:hypothetical protein
MQTYTLKYSVVLMQPGVFNIAPTISISSLDPGDDDDKIATPKKYILHSPIIIAHRSQIVK